MTILLRGHGLGNDYLVLEEGDALSAEVVRKICDRHTGVGADGILEPFGTPFADYGVRIWNPDGSVAEKSGNGLRIFARWLHDLQGAPTQFSLWTGTSQVKCEVRTDVIRIAMGGAVVEADEVEVEGRRWAGYRVDIGNPHFVIFVSDFDFDWRRVGAAIETHPAFPDRTNVQFARADETLEARIWERGAGETLASGSSSCAVAAAAVVSGRRKIGRHAVHMEGGVLDVAVNRDLLIGLSGPAVLVARIELLEGWDNAPTA